MANMNNHHKYNIERIHDGWDGHGNISIARVMELAYMARNDIWPDGSYGDDECIIWSEFRRVIKQQ